jgi:glutaredoxin
MLSPMPRSAAAMRRRFALVLGLPLSAGLVVALNLLSAGSGIAASAETAPPPGHTTSPNLGEPLQPSSAEQLALSEHLKRKGVIFYGAWWCPACFKQKNLFGKEAGARLPYVECDKTEGGRERCEKAGIRAYPTWVLGEERVEGVQTLEELRRWSGFPTGGTAGSPRLP